MAATTTQQPPSVFTFLKHGVLLPASRCGLFLQLIAVSTGLSVALHLFKPHTMKPLGPVAADLLVNFRRRHVDVEALATLVVNLLTDQGWLLLVRAVYVAAVTALGFVIQIATVSAAVVSVSSERHTFVSFLRKVKGNSTGPVVTAALGWFLKEFVRAIFLYYAASSYYHCSLRVLLRHAILCVLAVLFYHFLDVVCAVAIVASVAEPGLCGTDPIGRAWRLMNGGEGQAALYVTGTLWLGGAVSDVCTLAVALLPRTAATIIVYYLLLGAAQVFSAATVTAYYYFECSKCNVEDQKAGHTE